jgi:hypothetical protein
VKGVEGAIETKRVQEERPNGKTKGALAEAARRHELHCCAAEQIASAVRCASWNTSISRTNTPILCTVKIKDETHEID